MIAAIALSFGVVFVAELGDKSQLMALTFAMRYSWRQVLLGITVAAAIVHALSATVGHVIGSALPTTAVAIAAGLAFVGFGLWTLRSSGEDAAPMSARTGFTAVALTFLLAELGDKTMLATLTLATHTNGVGVWLGSTAGMVAADALAVAIGLALGRRIPQHTMTIASATIFVMIGSFAATAAVGSVVVAAVVAATCGLAVVGIVRARRARIQVPSTVSVEPVAA